MAETITNTIEATVTPTVEVTEMTTTPKKFDVLNEDGSINASCISKEDMTKYENLSKSLNTKDINSIINFGSDVQSSLKGFSHDYLKTVRLSKAGEIGDLMSDVLMKIQSIDLDGIKDTPFWAKMRKFPIISWFAPSIQKRVAKYGKVENGIKEYEEKLKATALISQRDNNTLAVMFDRSVITMQRLHDTIVAGKIALEKAKAELQEMMNNGAYDELKAQDLQEFINNLDKRVNDLMTHYYSTKLTLPQIRAVQYNNITIANNAQTLINTTLPIWRDQLAFAVTLNNQKKSVDVHRAISDATNEMMKKNAALLHSNTIEVAKEAQRSAIDIDTLKQVTEELVNTLNEKIQIDREGIAKRKEVEAELIKMSNSMKMLGESSSRNFIEYTNN